MHARLVEHTPEPNSIIENQLWNPSPPLRVTALGGPSGRDRRTVQIQAVHDARAISFLVRWGDNSETFVPRFWQWHTGESKYDLIENPVDQVALMWPLSRGASACMQDPVASRYDVWQWSPNMKQVGTGWVDLTLIARDRGLNVHPLTAREAQNTTGTIYPATHGRKKIHFEWLEDSGKPPLRLRPRPEKYVGMAVPGYEVLRAAGSAADILARGIYISISDIYGVEYADTTDEKTPRRFNPNPAQSRGYWALEFYRLLISAGGDEDYQMRGPGPHRFALAIWDNDSGGRHYQTGWIRLVLDDWPE